MTNYPVDTTIDDLRRMKDEWHKVGMDDATEACRLGIIEYFGMYDWDDLSLETCLSHLGMDPAPPTTLDDWVSALSYWVDAVGRSETHKQEGNHLIGVLSAAAELAERGVIPPQRWVDEQIEWAKVLLERPVTHDLMGD